MLTPSDDPTRPQVLTVPVLFDDEPVPVTIRTKHWLPQLVGTDGMAIGTTIYTAQPRAWASFTLLAHELLHVLDFVRLRRRTWRTSTPLAVGWDLARYAGQWLAAGFRYRHMAEEAWAYQQQALAAAGQYPGLNLEALRIEWHRAVTHTLIRPDLPPNTT